MRLKEGLIRHPMLRVDLSHQSERHATWLELFYDLAYVAAIGALGVSLKSDFTWHGLSKFTLLFVPVWWSWVGHTFYLSRFDSDDLIHRLLGLVQIIGAVSLAVQIPGAMEGNTGPFALAFACVRLVLVGQYLYAGFKNRSARSLTTMWASGFCLGAILWASSSLVSSPWSYFIWLVAVGVDFVTPFIRRAIPIRIPPNYSHISERLGLFTIIVLGETILASASGVRFDELTVATSIALTLGLIAAFAIWWTYFEGVKGNEVAPPTQEREIVKIQYWLFLHLPLAIGIVVTAVGVKKVMASNLTAPIGLTTAAIISTGMVAASLTLQAIWLVGLKPRYAKFALRLGWPHLVATISLIVVGFLYDQISAIAWIASMVACLIIHMVVDIFSEPESVRIARIDPHDPMAQPF